MRMKRIGQCGGLWAVGCLVGLVLSVTAPGATAERYCTVQPGDTLSAVARRELGDSTRWRELAKLNRLPTPYRIAVGQRLVLPASPEAVDSEDGLGSPLWAPLAPLAVPAVADNAWSRGGEQRPEPRPAAELDVSGDESLASAQPSGVIGFYLKHWFLWTVAGFLVPGGLIAALSGSVMFYTSAFKKSIAWGLGVVLVPGFVGLIYLVLHWQDAWRGYLVVWLGWLLAAVGGICFVWPLIGVLDELFYALN